jgi:transcriptional regulator with XRE-family HTH domain
MALAVPTVRRQKLGEELRALREAAGWSLTTAGQRIDASVSKICPIESGQTTTNPEDVAALLAVYGVTGPQRRELLELAREAKKRGWWQRHLLDYRTCRNTLFHQEARASTIINLRGKSPAGSTPSTNTDQSQRPNAFSP